jgi:hypothetical protein
MNHNNVTPVLCICNESILDAETFSKFDRCGHLLQLMEVVIVYILYLTMEFPGPTSCWCHHFHPCQGHYWSTLCMLVCITAAGSGNLHLDAIQNVPPILRQTVSLCLNVFICRPQHNICGSIHSFPCMSMTT